MTEEKSKPARGWDPAFARPATISSDGHIWNYESEGMTIREYMAAHIMAGFGADHNTVDMTPEDLAFGAVRWTDALLKELEKDENQI